MTTGAAATSRCVRKYTAAVTLNNIMLTKNTRRPSRSRSRNAPSAPEGDILDVQNNLANSYVNLGRFEEALPLRRDVYSGRLRLDGEEYLITLRAANNYADVLSSLQRFEEAKSLMSKIIP